MSDLQCAARLVALNPPSLTDPVLTAKALAHQNLAALYCADDPVCSGLATWLAQHLGLNAQAVATDDLADGAVGFEQITDLHRGETVVLVRPGSSPVPVLLLVDSDGIVTRPLT